MKINNRPQRLIIDASTIMKDAYSVCPVLGQVYGHEAVRSAVMILLNLNIRYKNGSTALESYCDPLEEFLDLVILVEMIPNISDTRWMDLDFELASLRQVVQRHLHSLIVEQWMGRCFLVFDWVSDTCVVLELE